MKRPCRYLPTPEQQARLQAARAAWASDPANRVHMSVLTKGRPRAENGAQFRPGTSSAYRPWPKARAR